MVLKNALEPFLLLGKSCKGSSSAIQLVEQAISSSFVFVFWELFHIPCISALETESPATFRKLQLFSVGTMTDYLTLTQQNGSSYYSPPLSEQQIRKLRLLSLISLCTKSTRFEIGYDEMFLALGMTERQEPRELEGLLMEAMELGLFRGKINQKNKLFLVKSFISRDLTEKGIQDLIVKAKKWKTGIEATIETLKNVKDMQCLSLITESVNEIGSRDRNFDLAFNACKEGINSIKSGHSRSSIYQSNHKTVATTTNNTNDEYSSSEYRKEYPSNGF